MDAKKPYPQKRIRLDRLLDVELVLFQGLFRSVPISGFVTVSATLLTAYVVEVGGVADFLS